MDGGSSTKYGKVVSLNFFLDCGKQNGFLHGQTPWWVCRGRGRKFDLMYTGALRRRILMYECGTRSESLRENFARLDFQIAFCLTLLIGLFACLYTFSFYRNESARGWKLKLPGWTAAFEFSLDTLGGFKYSGLILSSVLGLFLELLMIRWMSSEVRIFAFLKNYMLVSCFLGFGLGCFLCRKRINLIAMAAPLLSLVFLIRFPWQPMRALISALPSYLGVA